MEYVMVPVPEELADETKQFLMGLDIRTIGVRAEASFDARAADRMLSALNPRTRTALSLLAGASATGKHLTVRDLARRTKWTEHDTVGVITELSELVWAALGPLVSMIPSGPTVVARGSVNWDERVVVVAKVLAVSVVAADDRLAEGA